MKIRLDLIGTLFINSQQKDCPHSHDDSPCGTWCALFKDVVVKIRHSYPDWISIDLCQGTWTCPKEDFIDERSKE